MVHIHLFWLRRPRRRGVDEDDEEEENNEWKIEGLSRAKTVFLDHRLISTVRVILHFLFSDEIINEETVVFPHAFFCSPRFQN